MSKYENENPLDKLHPGEPYFFIRAQDIHSAPIVQIYACMLRSKGDDRGANNVMQMVERINQWQEDHPDKVKNPD
jgi:hypothetical protein